MLQYLLTLTDEKNYEKATELYETYKDYMLKYSYIKFCNKNRHNPDLDAFDAVQAAFARIIKYFDRIDFSRSENDIKNYIFSVLNNEIRTILRENIEFLEIDEEKFSNSEYNFIEELHIQLRYQEVVEAIKRLDDKYRDTLLHIFVEGMSVNDIAEMMGIPAKTVYTRLERGKRLLLDLLKGVNADE